jgi:outer membrane beta-barrel protein
VIRKVALSLVSVIVVAVAAAATAAEPEAVVVRNRLYSDDNSFEVQLITDLSINNSLTSIDNFQLNLSYHFHEAWAVELIAGYALGGPTDLQCQAQNPSTAATCNAGTHSIFAGAQANARTYEDLPNLWVLNGFNAQVGLRWEPIYGKLSLLTELPVHFKWFIALDGGAAQFSRTSVDFCSSFNPTAVTPSNTAQNSVGDCGYSNGAYETLVQNDWSWLASAATGLRFVVISGFSIEAALRDYVWADSYPISFAATQFPSNGSNTLPANVKLATGLSNTLFADLGLSWTF